MRRHPEAHRRPCKRGVPRPAVYSGRLFQKYAKAAAVRSCVGRAAAVFCAPGQGMRAGQSQIPGRRKRRRAHAVPGPGMRRRSVRTTAEQWERTLIVRYKKLPRLFESPKDPIYAAAADGCVVRSAHANGYALRAGCIYGSISISVSKYRSWKATWAAISAAVKVAPAGATTHLSSTSFFRWMTATFSPVKEETGLATPST